MEMEVTEIQETKAYELADEGKDLNDQTLVRLEGSTAHKDIYS